MGTPEIALIISAASFIVSVITLWVVRLSPSALRVTYGQPTLAIYKVRTGGQTWWIPSFDTSLSILNDGGQYGEIADLRIIADWKGHHESRQYEFYANKIVDYASFLSDRKERSQWERSAVREEWHSVLLQGHSEKHIHIVLEGPRWDAKQAGDFSCTLQIKRSRKWISLDDYRFSITEPMYDDTSISKPLELKRQGARKL